MFLFVLIKNHRFVDCIILKNNWQPVYKKRNSCLLYPWCLYLRPVTSHSKVLWINPHWIQDDWFRFCWQLGLCNPTDSAGTPNQLCYKLQRYSINYTFPLKKENNWLLICNYEDYLTFKIMLYRHYSNLIRALISTKY